MDKSKTNIIIDTLLFLCIIAIIGIGMLMKFILLPGKETVAVYGEQVQVFFRGMDRHEWGAIHLAVVYVFLGLLTLHIILHWKMIVAMYHRLIGNKVARCMVLVLIAVIGVFLAVFPLFIEPEVQEKVRKDRHRQRGMIDELKSIK
ncbi:MAG: DUF4405 domain-containing protein [Candidatus Loosdrechtia sp.]|uniref:DUF4405 domain-containing protein n=1 Tax=Candidatus Loosdrechtia sp. TaxID=3101272 RepID=UPI003A6185FF|nr:MAG: DUF4405 domain-containing protein [Candidatus Jettenia sp. AMX2]